MAEIEIFESDKEDPVVCIERDGPGIGDEEKKDENDQEDYYVTKKGRIVIQFKKETEVIWVEFDFSDTMLTVHAYSHGEEKHDHNIVAVDYV